MTDKENRKRKNLFVYCFLKKLKVQTIAILIDPYLLPDSLQWFQGYNKW